MEKKASIIIPCGEIDEYVEECIEGCLDLDYPDFEIILLPDGDEGEEKFRGIEEVEVVSTGSVSPGRKRNEGMEIAEGEILAFIDSDAYPREDWLKNAAKHLREDGVGGVGGPGVTPPEDSYLQKAGGKVLSSFMVGSLSSRYDTKEAFESDEIHSCNFVSTREALEGVQWDEKYWPGEDTLISLELKEKGYRLLEAPDVVIYHHRRPMFRGHLEQVSNFGFQRGYFAKRFPENSAEPRYFVPSLFTAFLFLGAAASTVLRPFAYLYGGVVSVYLLAALTASLKAGKYSPLVLPGIILTHIAYGVNFIRGYTAKEGLTI